MDQWCQGRPINEKKPAERLPSRFAQALFSIDGDVGGWNEAGGGAASVSKRMRRREGDSGSAPVAELGNNERKTKERPHRVADQGERAGDGTADRAREQRVVRRVMGRKRRRSSSSSRDELRIPLDAEAHSHRQFGASARYGNGPVGFWNPPVASPLSATHSRHFLRGSPARCGPVETGRLQGPGAGTLRCTCAATGHQVQALAHVARRSG
ncbi:hypothetical protein TARUN_8064 [Trichoderma arundinaceum]|uniref:Uncharacterized protein n=1 Tax=Trichoderma arundinaceum TaxID=490622 RepID=A0A395NDL3_TRIAR|nr:hypothetical protein TARUN_8064 [Trichoderma arundinaceum]